MSAQLEALPDHLFDILRQFASLRPPRSLHLPELPFNQIHEFFLRWILLNPHFEVYPPSRQYQALFWKWAIQKLEELAAGEDAEIDERIYVRMISLMPSSSGRNVSGCDPPGESYVTYIWKGKNSVDGTVVPDHDLVTATLLESRTLIEGGTTGLKTWTGGVVLAQYLIAHPAGSGRRVLELGCGAGILGIVVATLQRHGRATCFRESEQVPALWLTDVNDDVLERCHDNINLLCNASSRHPNINCHVLDWTDALDIPNRPTLQSLLREVNADVILGADVVYDPGIIPALVRSLCLALESGTKMSNKHSVAYIALTVRNDRTVTLFLETAGHLLAVRELRTLPGSLQSFATDMNDDQQVKIYEIRVRDSSR